MQKPTSQLVIWLLAFTFMSHMGCSTAKKTPDETKMISAATEQPATAEPPLIPVIKDKLKLGASSTGRGR